MADRAYTGHGRLSQDYRSPLVLVGLALIVRVYLYVLTFVISRDGVTFLSLAQCLKQGEIAKALGHDYHPFYSVLIAAGSYLIGDAQLAGQIISIVAGSLLVIPMFYLGKNLFNEKVGFVTGLLVAFHPHLARISVDVLSDSLYIIFFATGIAIGWNALERRGLLCFFLTGACAAFAYLTRPEGIGILIVIMFWILIGAARRRRFRAGKAVASALLLVIGFLIFASPYLLYLRIDTGHWTITKKKSIVDLMGIQSHKGESPDKMNHQTKVEKPSTQGETGRSTSSDAGNFLKPNIYSGIDLECFKKGLKFFIKLTTTFHPLLFLFLLFGIYKGKGVFGMDRGQWFILSFLFLYLPILYLLLLNIGYVSHRHLLPVTVIGLVWAAFGIQESRSWVVRKIFESNPANRISLNKISLFVMILIIVILLPMTLKPQRSDKVWIKKAGLWIAENCPANSRIMGYDSRIAYYAGGTNVETLAKYTFQEIKRAVEGKEVDIVVLESHQVDRVLPDSLSVGRKTLNLVHELTDLKGKNFLVYRVL